MARCVLKPASMRRALASLAALAALAVTAASCLSPTLPLPPPSAPDTIASTGSNLWVVAGTCSPGALVTVMNSRTNRGAVVQDVNNTGSYSVTIAGLQCDAAWVEQSDNDGNSSETSFVLQAYQNGIPVDPNACP